jgi:hypothetical protein
MRMEIPKATIAMLHQGKYKQDKKLKSIMSKMERKGFILFY